MELYKLKDFYSQKKQKEGSHTGTKKKKKKGIVIARLPSFSNFPIDRGSIKQVTSLVLIR